MLIKDRTDATFGLLLGDGGTVLGASGNRQLGAAESGSIGRSISSFLYPEAPGGTTATSPYNPAAGTVTPPFAETDRPADKAAQAEAVSIANINAQAAQNIALTQAIGGGVQAFAGNLADIVGAFSGKRQPFQTSQPYVSGQAMTDTTKLLLVGGILVFAYLVFFRKKASSAA